MQSSRKATLDEDRSDYSRTIHQLPRLTESYVLDGNSEAYARLQDDSEV